jgi:hypothetical protein
MYGGVTIGQLCVLCSVHGCGLVSAALARVMEGGPWQALSQKLFVGLLVVVAFTTVISLGNAPQHWFVSAATLAVMVVTATCDFARPL